MVNNVSFNGGNYSQYSNDINNVAKYATGSYIVRQNENPLSGIGLMVALPVLTETPKVFKWFKTAKEAGNISASLKSGANVFKTDFTKILDGIKAGGLKNVDNYKSVWTKYSAKVVEESAEKALKTTKIADNLSDATKVLYTKASDAAKIVAKTPGRTSSMLVANGRLAQAEAAAAKELAAAPAKGLGKVGQFLGKITGITKLKTKVAELATKSPVTAKILKFGKGSGAGLNAIIEGGIETFTQVIPTFKQLGVSKGIVQTFKSGVKVAASVGGWTAGAAVGAAIGSVIPGAGTIVGGVVGSVIGMVGGVLGSWGATKLATSVVGKNELDKYKEEQAANLTKQAANNPEVVQQIVATASERLQSEGADSEDARIASTSINKLAGSATPSQSFSGASTNPYMTYNPYNIYNPYSNISNLYGNSNQYGMSINPFIQSSTGEKDFMAECAGLV